MDDETRAKVEAQLDDLGKAVDRLATKAEANMAEGRPALRMRHASVQDIASLCHLDELAGGDAPLSIFCEFEGLIFTVDTDEVLLTREGAEAATTATGAREKRAAAYAALRMPLKDGLAKLEAVGGRLAPGFEDFAELCAIRSARICVLTRGLKPVVRHFLRSAGLGHIEVLGNELSVSEEGSWRLGFRDHSDTGHSKAESIQRTLVGQQQTAARVVMLGTDSGDFDAVEAGLVQTLFAPDGSGLAARCDEAGLRRRSFVSWAALVDELQLA